MPAVLSTYSPTQMVTEQLSIYIIGLVIDSVPTPPLSKPLEGPIKGREGRQGEKREKSGKRGKRGKREGGL